MFTFTFRIKNKTVLIGLCAVVMALCGMLVGVKLAGGPGSTRADGAGRPTGDLKLTDNEQRLEFLEAMGWKALEEPTGIEEIIIPQEFDPLYLQYNQLQQQQGFDLEKIKGKRVKRYRYSITNFAEGKPATASLLILSGRLVGGDITPDEVGSPILPLQPRG